MGRYPEETGVKREFCFHRRNHSGGERSINSKEKMDVAGRGKLLEGRALSRQGAGRKWRVALVWEHRLSIATDGKECWSAGSDGRGVGVHRGRLGGSPKSEGD